MPSPLSQSLRRRFAQVKLLLTDVDGILTDASVYLDHHHESKRFCVLDGLGLRLFREQGLQVGWISGRSSPATQQRARECGVDFLYQGPGNKVVAAEAMLAQSGVAWKQVCYMGDDVVDLGVLRRAGAAVTVPQAAPEAKALAHYVTKTAGGYGAVREVIELILKAQHKWAQLIQQYSA